jgi:hypothetical protein
VKHLLDTSFPSEIELVLRQRAAALGKDVDTFVREIIIEEVADIPAIEECAVSHAEFMARLDAMIERHGIRNGNFDDSRESIYSGRGKFPSGLMSIN